nr:MAG TPA: hypothetical protein [Caudoviricetes sp.]
MAVISRARKVSGWSARTALKNSVRASSFFLATLGSPSPVLSHSSRMPNSRHMDFMVSAVGFDFPFSI